jgi:hypothetical protein
MSRRDEFIQVAETVPFDNSTNGFTSDLVQTAIEEAKQNSEGFPRLNIRGNYNGVVGNNQWLGAGNELLNNTPFIVFAIDTSLREISWSNQNSNVQFTLEFRLGSKTGTIFYSLIVTSPNAGNGYVNNLNLSFSAGDVIYIQYKDNGTNCSDMDLNLWLSRTA